MTNQTSAVASTAHINLESDRNSVRLYLSDGDTVREHCHDGKTWTPGGFSAPGQHVSATNIIHSDPHVFCTTGGIVREWVYGKKGGWSVGRLEQEAPLPKSTVAQSTAVVSWHKAIKDKRYMRLFTCDGTTVTERCYEGGRWSQGAFCQKAEMVTAAQFHDGHLRVYCTSGDSITEWCYDDGRGWYMGDASLSDLTRTIGQPVATAATGWTEGPSFSPRLRLYVSNGVDIHEFCYQPSGWAKGGFTTRGQLISANLAGSMQLFCTSDGATYRWDHDSYHDRWDGDFRPL